MPQFEYDALTLSGERMTGMMVAESRERAHDALRNRGLYPRSITELTLKRRGRAAKPLSNTELAVFLGQFSSLYDSGIPFVRCIEALAQHADNARVRTLLVAVNEDVQRGFALSGALENQNGAFPPLLVQTVRAGEMGSTLSQSLRAMAVHYEKRHALVSRVRGALTYPCIVLGVAIAIVTFLMTNVIPTFSGLFESSGVPLPVPTRILLSTGAFIGNNFFALIAGVAAIALIVRALFKHDKTRLYLSERLLDMRVIGRIVRYTNAALYARTLSTLMSAGVSFIDAMTMAEEVVTNTYIRATLDDMEVAVKQGATLHAALGEAGWAPPLLLSMVSLGEEAGTLEEMLSRAGDHLDGEANAAISKATALIEPGVIILLGVTVAFIVLSVLTPMFSLSNVIGF